MWTDGGGCKMPLRRAAGATVAGQEFAPDVVVIVAAEADENGAETGTVDARFERGRERR